MEGHITVLSKKGYPVGTWGFDSEQTFEKAKAYIDKHYPENKIEITYKSKKDGSN